MTTATLLQLAGADLTPAKIGEASLVLIDLQNEYLAGPIALPGAEAAMTNSAKLLSRARDAGSPVFHVAHRGKAGGLFDRGADRGAIAANVAPRAAEAVIEKEQPNAFAGTELRNLLSAAGRKNIILVGLMTHMCISSTARAATELGFRVTIDASACATRDLPDGKGGAIAAQVIHEVALAELSDRFAIIARDGKELL